MLAHISRRRGCRFVTSDDRAEYGDETDGGVEHRLRSIDALERDDEDCHWSPYCSREGSHYVTTHVGKKPFKVWVCDQCR